MNGANGSGNRHGRHVRFDGRIPGEVAPAPSDDSNAFFSSGRVLVVSIILSVLLLWGGLNLAFRQWRAGYRERADYGAKVVAVAIDPLAEIVPSAEVSPIVRTANLAGAAAALAGLSTTDVDPKAWRNAVEQTHRMLVTLTAANVLDRDGMTKLGARISERVQRSKDHPETARMELAELWDEISKGAGILTETRHPRPSILPPKIKTDETKSRSGSSGQ